jgi:hypothetical protein
MKRVSATIQIAAAPMAVWAVLTDLSRYRKWHPLFPRASGQIAVGNRIMLHNMAPSGRVRTVRPKILVVEPGVELTWKATIPGLMGGTHRFELSPVGNGTRLVQSETFHGILVPVSGHVIARAEAGYHAVNQALKKRVESRKRH